MTKNKNFFLAFIAILTIVVAGVWKVGYAQSGIPGLAKTDENEINDIISDYFEIRYRALGYDQPTEVDGIRRFFSSESLFLNPEVEKLGVEIQHAKKYHLRYSQYKLFLDIEEISFDSLTELATVSVIEGHDVIFEISEEMSKSDPIVSSMRNLTHEIQLHKDEDGWKIVSDLYNDYLWRFIRATGSTTSELIQYMDETPTNIYQPQMMTRELDQEMACSLPSDYSTHPYGRNGAINYARRWATAPRPYNHPPYDVYY